MRVKGKIIAKECAKLLGINNEDAKEIKETLELAYNRRNLIVHGEDFEIEAEEDLYLDDLIVDVEELLRNAIKCIIMKL